MRRGLVAIAGLFALAACAGGGERERELRADFPELLPWTATERAVLVARIDCHETADFEMRSRGWPARPSPGTPQVGFRAAFFERCMERRGFDPGD